jgi:AraC-like DNA-binding protein
MIAHALQHRILSLANQVGPRADAAGAPATLHRYVVRTTETVRNYVAEAPALALILEGRKTIWRGGVCEIFRPGQLVLIPARFALDVTNEPCVESGRYRAMLLEFSPALIERFCNAYPETPERLPGASSLRVSVEPPLAESLGHVLEALLSPELHGNLLAEHRLMEVLLRLRRQGCLPDLVGLSGGDADDRVRELIRLNPAEEWTAERLAPLLGMSVATLGRKLRPAGGLRKLLEEERMTRAKRLLQGGGVSVSDVAYRCGYASPARFAVRFRAHHGAAPSSLLAQHA